MSIFNSNAIRATASAFANSEPYPSAPTTCLPTPAVSRAAFTAKALDFDSFLLAASSPFLSVYPPIFILVLDRLSRWLLNY
jgi:hypothetical protein